MSKFLYPIYKLNIESYKKWWLYHKKAGGSGILSEILQGFSFNLENTLNRKFKLFEIEGNSVQDGSPSPDNEVPIYSAGDNENLFDIGTSIDDYYHNNVITELKEKEIRIKVAASGLTYSYRLQNFAEKKQYAISAKASNQYGRIFIRLRNNEDTAWLTSNDVSIKGWSYNSTYTGWYKDFNSTSINTIIEIPECLYWQFGFGFSSIEAYVGTIQTISNIKIEQGNKASGYSPYEMGSINQKINNKNWFNKNGNFKTYNATVTPIDTGIKVENNDGGTYRSVWCEIGKDELLGKTLTIQTSISTYNGAIPRIIVVFNNETAQYIVQIKTITDTTEGTLVNIPNSFPENADRVSLIFYCSFTSATPKGSYVEYKDLQVELGTTATPYVEHKEQDYSIFVQQPFRSTKDKTIKDKFVIKSDGKIYERHYISRKIFDGTEYWTISTDQGGHSRFDFRIADAVLGSITNNPIQSNRFRTNFAVEDNSIFLSGVEPMISIICDEFRTLDGFKTMLAEKYANGNPVYADYLRKTPLDLPCTPEQIQQLENKPSTYKDFTIIQSEDETSAHLKIQYWKEVQS